MIAEQYISEGVRIRKSYVKNLTEILSQEPKILERKKSFQKVRNEMESIVKSDINDVRKTLELNSKLMMLEKEIIAIQNVIKPYSDAIEDLRNDMDKLYVSIKEKYPDISNEQIEQDIMSKVEK